jgi:hypothetical protein
VGEHRDLLDPGARLGVPGHVTVLFPFVPPAQIDPVVVAELRQVAGTAAFDFRLIGRPVAPRRRRTARSRRGY